MTRKALAARLPAEHAWLYRHDRRWLDVHSPAPARRSPPGRRMDWESIDLDLAGALRRAAEELSRRIEPVRITLAELERQIARNGWIGRRRDKLAKTAAVLAEVTETVEAFQLRRIAWARDKIERSDPAVPVWKIRRLAGLPAQASAAVEHALDATHCGCRRNS